MQIIFNLQWQKTMKSVAGFKLPGMGDLTREYLSRINHFASCSINSQYQLPKERKSAHAIWICDAQKGSESISSEQLAKKLQVIMDSGIKNWHILIGGPDGFTKNDLPMINPSVRWNFGPITLPHELALVVAMEQVYRAFAILNNHPYHGGH